MRRLNASQTDLGSIDYNESNRNRQRFTVIQICTPSQACPEKRFHDKEKVVKQSLHRRRLQLWLHRGSGPSGPKLEHGKFPQCAQQTQLSIASDVDHDSDAIYFPLSPASRSLRAAHQVDQIQNVDCYCSITAVLNQTFDARELWHPPDKDRHCPIYLLNRSIRC